MISKNLSSLISSTDFSFVPFAVFERLCKRDDLQIGEESSFLRDFIEKYVSCRADLSPSERRRLFEYVSLPHLRDHHDFERLRGKEYADNDRLLDGLIDHLRLKSGEDVLHHTK